MPSINFDDIEYSELVTFLAVAETLNMTIAAERLFVTQPAVSKRIANLESRYGLILFVRAGRKLQLTPAGRALRHDLLKSMEHLQQAFVNAAKVQAEPLRTLRLAYDGFFDIPLLYEVVRRYTDRHPNERVYLYSCPEESCVDLFNGAADVMICPDNYRETAPSRIEGEVIASFQFCAIMSKDHPLASRDRLAPQDLVGIPLTVARMDRKSPYLGAVRQIFQKHGISPRFERFVQRENLLFSLLSDGGVAIASPAFWRRLNARTEAFYDENLVAFPLEGERLPVSLLWSAEGDQVLPRQFLDAFHEVVAKPGNREILDRSYG